MSFNNNPNSKNRFLDMQYEPGLCSICCLCYNHAPYIEEAIRAIWKQKYQNIEIIALDDGSPDNSAEILEKLKDESPLPMKVFTQENSGNIAGNFNKMIDHAKGEFIAFISIDDKFYDDALSSKIPQMIENSNIVVIANTQYTQIDGNSNITDEILTLAGFEDKEICNNIDDLIEVEFKYIGAFYIQGAVFRADIIKAIGGYDEDLLGDDIIIRTKLFQHMQKHPELTFKLLQQPAVYYRIHDTNIHKNSYRQIILVMEWLRRYFPNRKAPKLFLEWHKHAIKQNINQNNFRNVIKLMFLDKKIIFSTHQLSIIGKFGFKIIRYYLRYLLFGKSAENN